MAAGRIDVHSHLLPGVDDGCKSVEESIACARVLVANGYTPLSLPRAQRGGYGGECSPVEVVGDAGITGRVRRELE